VQCVWWQFGVGMEKEQDFIFCDVGSDVLLNCSAFRGGGGGDEFVFDRVDG